MDTNHSARFFERLNNEAGHTVVGHLLRFRPKRIEGPLSFHDRRTTSFFRYRPGIFDTPKARERAADYAIYLVAGVVAESKYLGVPVDDALRGTSGAIDYEKVNGIMASLLLINCYQDSPEVRKALLQTWEAKANAMLTQPEVWSAVDRLVGSLQICGGVLDAEDIRKAIKGKWSSRDAACNATNAAHRTHYGLKRNQHRQVACECRCRNA